MFESPQTDRGRAGLVGAMDPDVLVSHLDDFRDVLIKINDDVSALEPDTRPVTPRVDREPNRAPPASQNSSRRPRPTHWEDPTGPPPLGVPFGPSPRPASFPHTKHPQTFSNPDLTPQPPTHIPHSCRTRSPRLKA